ncbi:YitT family protein [Erysipelotrichaceae bacterium OttesenSCG-928-M19]|nr:YitT family protein [Erysipelotrichaceae bacterium OttesenSCG-928-M19]
MKNSLLKIFFGNLLMAFAYAKWMIPNEIINGGATSIAMILAKVTGLNILILTNGLEVFLLLCCALFLGKENALKSLFTSISFVICFNIFYLIPYDFSITFVIDLLIACLFIGFGYYCNLSENSSTVSVDVFALIIYKYYQKINLAHLIRYLNWLVLAFGLFVYGYRSVILGIIMSFAFTFILDIFTKLNDQNKMFI